LKPPTQDLAAYPRIASVNHDGFRLPIGKSDNDVILIVGSFQPLSK
jgi:hypothetical protein